MDFFIDLRVYIEDTDAAGIVYYANYLKFMERARSDWLRTLGLSQARLRDEGIQFVVRRCELDLHKPARFDDALSVTAVIAHQGRASLDFKQQVFRQGQLLCEGKVRVACVDAASLKPVALPESITRTFHPSRGEQTTDGN